jgi:hypothetical protein
VRLRKSPTSRWRTTDKKPRVENPMKIKSELLVALAKQPNTIWFLPEGKSDFSGGWKKNINPKRYSQ